jgi:hypothetical protein
MSRYPVLLCVGENCLILPPSVPGVCHGEGLLHLSQHRSEPLFSLPVPRVLVGQPGEHLGWAHALQVGKLVPVFLHKAQNINSRHAVGARFLSSAGHGPKPCPEVE